MALEQIKTEEDVPTPPKGTPLWIVAARLLLVPILVAAVPSSIKSYYDYKKARYETAVGYETLAKAVDHLAVELHDVQLSGATTSGRVDTLEAHLVQAIMLQRQVVNRVPMFQRIDRTIQHPDLDKLKREKPLTKDVHVSMPSKSDVDVPDNLDKAIQATAK